MPSYDLRKLSSKELIANLKALVARDRQLTAEVIAHIAEVDSRGLFLESACSSMFSYCVSRLHMSESSAYNRIAAARAARRFPAIYRHLELGELHLTAVKLLGPRLTPENHHDLLEASKNLSKRGIERLIANRFPSPDVRTSMRKLPERHRPPEPAPSEVASAPGATATVGAAISSAPGATSAPSPALPGPALPSQPPLPPTASGHAEVRPLSETRYSLKLTMSSTMHEKLLRAQELMRHRLPGGELDTVLDRALDALLRELEQSKFGRTDKPRKNATLPREGSRRISNAIKREVAARDEHRCTFVDDQGRRCEERAFIEFDHIRPVGRGGTAKTADSVRLLCRAHNRYAAEKVFGKDFIRRKIAEAKRRGAAEPVVPERAPPKQATQRSRAGGPQVPSKRVAPARAASPKKATRSAVRPG